MRLRAVARTLFVSLLALCLIATPVKVAAQGNPQLTVITVVPNIGGGQLVIIGANLIDGPATVTLSDVPLSVLTSSPTLLITDLPADFINAPGTYQLKVIRDGSGSLDKRTGTLDVTIGVQVDGPVLGIDLAETIGFALATIKALKNEVEQLKQQVEQLKQNR